MRTRLFWKILLAFWLTFFAITQGVWLLFQLDRGNRAPPEHFMAEEMAPALLSVAHDIVGRSGRQGFDDFVRTLPARQGERLQIAVAGEAASSPVAGLGRVQMRAAAAPDGTRFVLRYWYGSDARRAGFFNMPPELLSLGVVGGLFFAAMLAWYLTRPINRLRKGFDRLAHGHFAERLAPVMGDRRDEIADLARDFDRMAERLDQLVASRDRLLHDVSHELRSPLARLQLAIGLARQSPSRIDASLDRIDREAGRLDALVGELLTLARSEHRDGAGEEYFDLVGVLRSVVDDARFEADSHDVSIRLSEDDLPIDQAPPVRGEAETVRRAIDNVVRNALRFSKPGQEVDVTYHYRSGRHVIAVGDRGPGIESAMLGAMFEPFARGHEDSAGFGLGLAIARRAVALHGGQIIALNRDGGGLLVQIDIPAGRADAG